MILPSFNHLPAETVLLHISFIFLCLILILYSFIFITSLLHHLLPYDLIFLFSFLHHSTLVGLLTLVFIHLYCTYNDLYNKFIHFSPSFIHIYPVLPYILSSFICSGSGRKSTAGGRRPERLQLVQGRLLW